MGFMSVDVTKIHKLPLENAKLKAEQVTNKIKSMKWCQGFSHQWDGDTINFRIDGGAAKGVKGYLRVTSAEISVHVDLTVVVLAGKAEITEEINKYLREAGVP